MYAIDELAPSGLARNIAVRILATIGIQVVSDFVRGRTTSRVCQDVGTVAVVPDCVVCRVTAALHEEDSFNEKRGDSWKHT